MPYTLNGKRVEVPVKKVKAVKVVNGALILRTDSEYALQLINGAPISSINPETLRNPRCLLAYVGMGKLLREEVDM